MDRKLFRTSIRTARIAGIPWNPRHSQQGSQESNPGSMIEIPDSNSQGSQESDSQSPSQSLGSQESDSGFAVLIFYHFTWSTSIAITTTKIQSTILKLAKPFHLQIQFWKLIQFFSWLFCTNILLVQSIWLRNEAYILFCCCVAWSIIDTLLTPIPYDTIHCHFFRITLNIDTKWVS